MRISARVCVSMLMAVCDVPAPLAFVFNDLQVIRGNSIGGIAVSAPGACGVINATNPLSADILSEGNTFDCPQGAFFPGNGTNIIGQHCLVQP